MSLTFHWFLPTQGDGRRLIETGEPGEPGVAGGYRAPSLPYLARITTAAEDFGFEGALTPTGVWCDDAWVVTAMLSQLSERLKFMVAFRPGLVSPTLAAQMASTFQQHSNGRLLLNVVTGGEDHEQRSFGDFLTKEQRYDRTAEFLESVDRLWKGETLDFDGEHITLEQAQVHKLPDPKPPIYFGGSSPKALDVAANQVDVYLTWGEPPEAVARKISAVKEKAEAAGRSVRFGVRLHTISRDSSEDAWREADRLLASVDPELVARVQEQLARSQSEGQKRMLALHGGSRSDLEVHPNLWAGVGLGRGGAGTALVGSHLEVADLIEEYARVGIDEFVLSGYPHLEELYWFGEGVMPELESRGLLRRPENLREGGSSNVNHVVPFTSQKK